ncbi:unnamed protein product [Prunus armeniaca]
MASSIEAGGSWTNDRRGQNLDDEIIQGKTKKRKLQMAPQENTPPRCDPVELPSPMIKSSFYSIMSDYEDHEYFNCMMSE